MNNIKYIIVTMIWLSIVLNPSVSESTGIEKITGIWEGTETGDWKSILEFRKDGFGNLICTEHDFYLGIKETETGIIKVEYNHPGMKIHREDGLVMDFVLSGDMKSMAAELDLPGGKMLYKMVKKDKNSVNGLYPKRRFHSDRYSYSFKVPDSLDDGWQISSPEKEGLDTRWLIKAVNSIISKDYGIISGLIIAKNGKLIMDEYFYGHTPVTLHPLSSVNKSVTSIILGIARDKGIVKNLDTPLYDYFPEYSSIKTEKSAKITVRHVLSMKAGFVDEEELWRDSKERFKSLLSRPVTHNPGTVFHYDNGTTEFLAGIIKKTSGEHIDQFAVKHLFAPMGIKNFHWGTVGESPYPMTSGSLRLTGRDMAKIGQLVIGKGKWNGKRVVSEEWIIESTKNHSDNYGYQWWIDKTVINGNSYKLIFASGLGSKLIFIAPELKMVVAITGGNFSREKHVAIFDFLAKYIAKAIKK